jgi:hypothetical protein
MVRRDEAGLEPVALGKTPTKLEVDAMLEE